MKLPSSLYNWTSVIGAVLAIISLFMIVFLMFVSIFVEVTSSYLGIVIYIIFPIFLILGLILIPVGMARRRRRMRRVDEAGLPRWPRVDLNLKQHRNAFTIFVISSTAFLFLSAVGTYEAFHFTESVEFCGRICHGVMHPEYTTYQISAHARVACVDCHVGSGADWYVRSKLSGLYQVYSVLFKKYPQPIPTPITDLRPAQETCERCHWPEQFYAHKLRTERHYLADEANTEWDIILKMKIGSEYHALGQEEGIHWHINSNVRIEYVADPVDRQVIPWVRYTNMETGEVHTYFDKENMIDADTIEVEDIRHMDCIDCHNRPSHEYFSPPFFTDKSLTRGEIPRELPDIKQVAMGLHYAVYEDTDSALATIEKDIMEYYELMYPEIFEQQLPLVRKAISGIQEDFRENIFPEMRARWDVYPNNIGHINSEGCYRCHNDRHTSQTGRVIGKDCNLCHDILAQGYPDELEMAGVRDSLEFIHPIDIGGAWKEVHCVICHDPLY
jgi:nitrate/TMAO reductase-like tetraheme cytochrome c subunit